VIVEKRIQNRQRYWKTNYSDRRATEIVYIYEKEEKETIQEKHRLVDKDIEHSELLNSEGDRTEQEDIRIQKSNLTS
jgi:hypothetical protein